MSNAVNFTDGLDGLAGLDLGHRLRRLWHHRPAAGADLSRPASASPWSARCSASCGSTPTRPSCSWAIPGRWPWARSLGVVALMTGQWLLLPDHRDHPGREALSVIIQVAYFKLTKGKRFFKMAPLHHHFELSRLERDPGGAALLADRPAGGDARGCAGAGVSIHAAPQLIASLEMHKDMMGKWQGKRVVILGAARQGQAAGALPSGTARGDPERPPPARRNDRRHESARPIWQLRWVLGDHPLEPARSRPTWSASPAASRSTIPILVEAQRRGIPLTNDSQIFMEAVPLHDRRHHRLRRKDDHHDAGGPHGAGRPSAAIPVAAGPIVLAATSASR